MNCCVVLRPGTIQERRNCTWCGTRQASISQLSGPENQFETCAVQHAARLDSAFQSPCFSDQHGCRMLFLPPVTAHSRGTCTLELLDPQMLGRWKKPKRCSKIPWTTSLWHKKVQHDLQVAKGCGGTGRLPPGRVLLEMSEAHTRLLQYTSEVPLAQILTSSRSTHTSVRLGSPKSLSGEVKAI